MMRASEVLELSRAFLPNPDGVREPPGSVMVLKVFMDESGNDEGSPVVTVAAYLGLPRAWEKWTRAWNRQKRPIHVFHSSDCSALQGEFLGWTLPEKNEFCAKLLPIIGEAEIVGFASGIRLSDYREIKDEYPELAEVVGDRPEAACFQWVLDNILTKDNALKPPGQPQTIAVVHEVNDYQGVAQAAFDYLAERDPDRKMTLTFGTKAAYPPLQAADVLAYETNRRLRDLNAPDRKSWKAINPTGVAREVKYYDKPALIKWAKGMRAKKLSEFLGHVRA